MRTFVNSKAVLIPLLVGTSLLTTGCFNKNKKEKPVSQVKRVVLVNPIANQYMENSDGSVYGLGEGLYNRLVTDLHNSKNFVVVVDEMGTQSNGELGIQSRMQSLVENEEPDRMHFEFAPFVAAEFNAQVEGLSYQNGSRGVTTWTGYRSEYKTPWNDGSFEARNEFTPRNLEFSKSWLGNTFDPIGTETDNTISGVNSGNEGEFNLIIFGIHYRRDSFLATAQVRTKLKLIAEQSEKEILFDSLGKGFLFGVGGNYKALSLDFSIKYDNARKLVFNETIAKMSAGIMEELMATPFRTKVEIAGEEGIYINAGRREGIQIGDVFKQIGEDGSINTYSVQEVFQIGSRIDTLDGSGDVSQGQILELVEATEPPKTNAINARSIASVKGAQNLSATPPASVKTRKITFETDLLVPKGEAYRVLSLKSALSLPRYLMRWKLYDQDVLQVAPVTTPGNSAPATWNLQAIDLPLAQQQSSARGDGVTVAIIDSGIDYNHSDLYQAFDRQNVGWDFFSFDNKPFDDNSHGTAIAGIIASQGSSQAPAGIAPRAKLLAFKAIDPYGQTSSAALYGAAQRAIASGARILVLAWDSGLDSRALQGIVALAEASNVLVVTAAGDQGRDLREFARFPAALSNRSPNIINVAALGKAGTLSKLYGRNSNFGDGLVDIAAPGESINTLAPRSLYLNRSGSDLAAAHVAGVAALLLSARPNLTGSDLKNALIQGGSQNPLLNGLVTGARMLSTPGSLHAISN